MENGKTQEKRVILINKNILNLQFKNNIKNWLANEERRLFKLKNHKDRLNIRIKR